MISKRIKLINCDRKILESITQGNDVLSEYLNVNVIGKWTEFGDQIFGLSLQQVIKNPDLKKWYAYLMIEIESNTLIGNCGYKGPPDENGMVEIGYEVAEKFRNRGYATEIAGILIKIAFEDKEIKGILAHTLPEENASVKVLKKCNFKFVKEVCNNDDGTVWQWKKEK